MIDGDTLAVRARIWLDLEVTVNIRIRGIDAPELRGACPHEKMMAAAAREHLAEIALPGSVQLWNIGEDKYFGRVVADVVTVDGRSVGPLMIESGLVRLYDGGGRQEWCDLAGLDTK